MVEEKAAPTVTNLRGYYIALAMIKSDDAFLQRLGEALPFADSTSYRVLLSSWHFRINEAIEKWYKERGHKLPWEDITT